MERKFFRIFALLRKFYFALEELILYDLYRLRAVHSKGGRFLMFGRAWVGIAVAIPVSRVNVVT